jgi:hypothetical protein
VVSFEAKGLRILHLSLDHFTGCTSLAMSDPGSKVIYRLQIRGSQATVVGTTTFKGPAPFGDFSIVPQGRHEKNGAVLIAAGTGDVGSLYFWNYPAGGRSFKKISGLNFVSGVAKSVGL